MKFNVFIKKTSALVFVSLFFLISAYSTCIAANYYVDNAAGGSNTGADWNNAWESFSSIDWSKVAAGDTVFISGGSTSKTYRESLTIGKSGASGNRITITKGTSAGHNGEVIIDGQNTRGTLIELGSRTYVTVSNLTVTNSSGGGRSINIKGGKNLIVDRNTIEHTRRAGVFIENATDCTISNNTMYTDDYVSEQTDGIYSQRNTNVTFDGNHITINNSHQDGHDDCIQSYVDNGITAKNNYCEQNNNKTTNAQGIYLSTSYGTLVAYNNVVKAPNTYNGLITIRLPNSGVNGIIVNNTVIGSKYGAIWVESGTPVVIKNNIAWGYNGGIPLYYSGDMDNVTNNIFDIDPELDSSFMPTSSSPVIDAGAPLSSPYNVDKNGVYRPQGNGFDIGAYEKTSSSTPAQISVDPPQNLVITFAQ